VAACPGCVESVTDVATIRRRDGVAASQLGGEQGIGNRSRVATVAELIVAAVPAVRRQPQLETNVRVGRGPGCALHATEGIDLVPRLVSRNEGAAHDLVGVQDARMRKFELR
jgi:hypothetical protein